MGARFDKAFDADRHTDYAWGDAEVAVTAANTLGMSSDDPDTVGNELRTHLLVRGDSFPFSDLLGSGMASSSGTNFVSEAVEIIQKQRDQVASLLGVDLASAALTTALGARWINVMNALDTVFGTDHDADSGATSAYKGSTANPGEDDILEDIDAILQALSSVDNFTAATKEDGGGVLEDAKLSAENAVKAFDRTKTGTTVTLDALGATRFGTFIQKNTSNAVTDLKYKHGSGEGDNRVATVGSMGAFAYSTMQETLRTRHVATTTGNAYYSGMTQAISGKGVVYMGNIDIQIRFSTNVVDGLITNLADADGAPWQYGYGDVEAIILPDANLGPNAKWTSGAILAVGSDTTADDAQATFARRAGSPGPQKIEDSRWQGILLGRNAASGSEATGIWEVGADQKGTSKYLVGGFGVTRGPDTPVQRPDTDDGTGAETKVFSMTGADPDGPIAQAAIADGKLTLKLNEYGKTDGGMAIQQDSDGNNKTMKLDIDLKALLAAGGKTYSGAKFVTQAVAELEKQRGKIETLIALDDDALDTNIDTAWNAARSALLKVFKSVPAKFIETSNNAYDRDNLVGLIDQALSALANAKSLEAAMDGDGKGIFNDQDAATADGATKAIKTTAGSRTAANVIGQASYQVLAQVGSTDYTRFGVWRLRNYRDASRSDPNDNSADQHNRGRGGNINDGPGAFAYSPLNPTVIADVNDPTYTPGGSASYFGETVAVQGTTMLTGEVRADVVWTSNTVGGTLTLTIMDLQNSNGDRLATSTTNIGRDLLITGITVTQETSTNNLVLGGGSATLNFQNRSTPAVGVGEAGVTGRFLGQTVDGPLAVIGTWTVQNSDLGLIKADGSSVVGANTAIYGAFGAEAP